MAGQKGVEVSFTQPIKMRMMELIEGVGMRAVAVLNGVVMVTFIESLIQPGIPGARRPLCRARVCGCVRC